MKNTYVALVEILHTAPTVGSSRQTFAVRKVDIFPDVTRAVEEIQVKHPRAKDVKDAALFPIFQLGSSKWYILPLGEDMKWNLSWMAGHTE